MQDAVKHYGLASSYGFSDYLTLSTYRIGELYRDFSKALLASERPSSLSDEELEQYDILLEDQAFPFEDKAIQFHEANVGRIATGRYDEWIKHSLDALSELFPARYQREGHVETLVRKL